MGRGSDVQDCALEFTAMPFLRSWFHVSQSWRTAFAAAGLLTLAAFVEAGEARGSRASRGRNVAVWRTPVDLAGQPEVLYIKDYHYDGNLWRYWARGSRAWREARNYRIFADLGIPGPETMAVGEQRHAFGLRRALVVTREVEDASNLEDVVETAEFAAGAAVRQRILEQAAVVAGRAHRRNFFRLFRQVRRLVAWGRHPTRATSVWCRVRSLSL
jgi:hypothetical protein